MGVRSVPCGQGELVGDELLLENGDRPAAIALALRCGDLRVVRAAEQEVVGVAVVVSDIAHVDLAQLCTIRAVVGGGVRLGDERRASQASDEKEVSGSGHGVHSTDGIASLSSVGETFADVSSRVPAKPRGSTGDLVSDAGRAMLPIKNRR